MFAKTLSALVLLNLLLHANAFTGSTDLGSGSLDSLPELTAQIASLTQRFNSAPLLGLQERLAAIELRLSKMEEACSQEQVAFGRRLQTQTYVTPQALQQTVADLDRRIVGNSTLNRAQASALVQALSRSVNNTMLSQKAYVDSSMSQVDGKLANTRLVLENELAGNKTDVVRTLSQNDTRIAGNLDALNRTLREQASSVNNLNAQISGLNSKADQLAAIVTLGASQLTSLQQGLSNESATRGAEDARIQGQITNVAMDVNDIKAKLANGTQAVNCTLNPSAPGCPQPVNCTLTPNAPGCPQPVNCTLNPSAPGCPQPVNCTLTPNAPGCPQPVNCTLNPTAPGCPQTNSTCDPTVLKPVQISLNQLIINLVNELGNSFNLDSIYLADLVPADVYLILVHSLSPILTALNIPYDATAPVAMTLAEVEAALNGLFQKIVQAINAVPKDLSSTVTIQGSVTQIIATLSTLFKPLLDAQGLPAIFPPVSPSSATSLANVIQAIAAALPFLLNGGLGANLSNISVNAVLQSIAQKLFVQFPPCPRAARLLASNQWDGLSLAGDDLSSLNDFSAEFAQLVKNQEDLAAANAPQDGAGA